MGKSYYHLANPKIIKAFDIIKEILYEKLSADSKMMARVNKI